MTIAGAYNLTYEVSACPFYDQNNKCCEAALLNDTLTFGRQLRHCLTDDHDHCVFYLAKMLRHSQPHCTASNLGEFFHK